MRGSVRGGRVGEWAGEVACVYSWTFNVTCWCMPMGKRGEDLAGSTAIRPLARGTSAMGINNSQPLRELMAVIANNLPVHARTNTTNKPNE